MVKRGLLVVVMLLAATGFAFAEGSPKWTYVQAGYIDFSPDNGLDDNGWYAGGSLQVFKNFHFLAEYDDIGNYTLWNAGFGWHGLFGEPADLFAEVVWNDVEVDTGNNSVSDNGYGVDAGVRWHALKWLEIKGQVNWVDYDTGGSDTTFNVGALFTIMNDRFGIGADYQTGGDADTLRGFFRISFGK